MEGERNWKGIEESEKSKEDMVEVRKRYRNWYGRNGYVEKKDFRIIVIRKDEERKERWEGDWKGWKIKEDRI